MPSGVVPLERSSIHVSSVGPTWCVVPHEQLSTGALRGLIEEFVTRDGTDYGHIERTLEQKMASVMHQLERGTAVIVHDRESGSATIVPAECSRDHGAR